MAGVTPQSTTAGLAGDVPKESERRTEPKSASYEMPGTLPETPFHDASEFYVNPMPATSGMDNPVQLAPGEKVPHPNTLTSNTGSSTASDYPSLSKNVEDSGQKFGVAPLPATSGIGNPISLKPGEKVPHPSTFTNNTINTYVRTDQASYENSTGAPQLPSVVTPERERAANGGMFDLPGITNNMIPESSLPMGGAAKSEPDPGVTIQSTGANSTTAALAGQVPLEPRSVPEIVRESQQEAGIGPEASGILEAVKEKTAMEKELESKVPEEPAISEGTGGEAAGGTATAAFSHGLPASDPKSIDGKGKGSAIAPTVPDVVQQSITESHVSPEAAGEKTMVGEKRAMEQELLKEVPKKDDVGEPAPSASAALVESAPAPTGAKNVHSTAAERSTPVTTAAAPAQPPATGNAMREAIQKQPESRDISPMSKPINPAQNQPSVTTGVGASSAPTTSQPTSQTTVNPPVAAKTSPAPTSSAAASTDKKSKRASGFFGKLKAKFSDKDKK